MEAHVAFVTFPSWARAHPAVISSKINTLRFAQLQYKYFQIYIVISNKEDN